MSIIGQKQHEDSKLMTTAAKRKLGLPVHGVSSEEVHPPHTQACISRFKSQGLICDALWCRRHAGFRTVTPDGDVHVVCLDHAHEFCRQMGIGLYPEENNNV